MSSELIPAATKQTIKINALRNTIANHIHEINRPYSTLISVTAFPAIMMLLLLNESSPFYGIYQAYYNRHYETRKQDGVIAFNTAIKDLIAPRKLAQTLKELLRQIQTIISQLEGQSLSLEETLEALDKNSYFMNFDEIAEIKGTCYSLVIAYLSYYSPRLVSDISKYTFSEICKGALSLNDFAWKITEGYRPTGENFATAKFIQLDFRLLMHLPKIIVTMLGQQFLIDPLLRRYFHSGIYQPRIPPQLLQKPVEQLQRSEASAMIGSLELIERPLKNKARRNIIISRMLIPIFLGICIANYKKEISAQLWFVFIFLISSAVKGIYHEVKHAYDNIVYRRNLNASHSTHNQLFADYFSDIVSYDEGNIYSSQFEITFLTMNGLGKRKVAEVFLNVLTHHKIVINTFRSGNLVLPATQVIPKKENK